MTKLAGENSAVLERELRRIEYELKTDRNALQEMMPEYESRLRQDRLNRDNLQAMMQYYHEDHEGDQFDANGNNLPRMVNQLRYRLIEFRQLHDEMEDIQHEIRANERLHATIRKQLYEMDFANHHPFAPSS